VQAYVAGPASLTDDLPVSGNASLAQITLITLRGGATNARSQNAAGGLSRIPAHPDPAFRRFSDC